MSWFRSYLIIGGRDAKLTETQRASGLQTVNIYDVKNKLVGALPTSVCRYPRPCGSDVFGCYTCFACGTLAFTGNFISVQHIFSEWGSVFLLTRDKQVCLLRQAVAEV